MKKRIMVITIALGLAGLAVAQTTPQNIIDAKTSDGYHALYLTERAVLACSWRPDQPRETGYKELLVLGPAIQDDQVKIQAGLGRTENGKADRPKNGYPVNPAKFRREVFQ